MCVIDWSAVAEWLSALGTLGAVIVALRLARRDKLDQLERERHEARIIALLLETDLLTIRVRANDLVSEISSERTDGLFAVMAGMDESVRLGVAEKAQNFPLATLEAVVGRLHVLPATASAAILKVITAVRELRLAASTLAGMTKKEASEDMERFLDHLEAQLKDLRAKAAEAIRVCEAVAA